MALQGEHREGCERLNAKVCPRRSAYYDQRDRRHREGRAASTSRGTIYIKLCDCATLPDLSAEIATDEQIKTGTSQRLVPSEYYPSDKSIQAGSVYTVLPIQGLKKALYRLGCLPDDVEFITNHFATTVDNWAADPKRSETVENDTYKVNGEKFAILLNCPWPQQVPAPLDYVQSQLLDQVTMEPRAETVQSQHTWVSAHTETVDSHSHEPQSAEDAEKIRTQMSLETLTSQQRK